MSRIKKNLVGEIGYCDNKDLNLRDMKTGKLLKGGHYVYIREVNGDRCNVNIVTSLENKAGDFSLAKLGKVKNGYLYPIPKGDANFNQWSAINLDGNKNNVPLSKVREIGCRKIKRRHKFFVGKFTKK